MTETAKPCDGHCEKMHSNGHRGPVTRVHVMYPEGQDWGDFNYCDTAKEMDRSAGFIVEEK